MTTSPPCDIIGDIHGYIAPLRELLTLLGYAPHDGVWSHPARQAIFVGDFVDRGPGQREVVELVRGMVDSGAARAAMGNHEFNALAFATCDPVSGEPLRRHSARHIAQHSAFLEAYRDTPQDKADALDWFRTLPMWLDLGDLRVVHACWDAHAIERLEAFLGGGNTMTDELLIEAGRPDTWQFEAVETLLKGKEIPLPPGHVFYDKEDTPRRRIRVRWWDADVDNYSAAFIGPESARTHIPDDPINGQHLVEYRHDAPPCFLGHYWLEGEIQPLAPNIACLDYSVARPGGRLVAYRWDGEQRLSRDKFVAVVRAGD